MIIVDVETTGLDPLKHSIISIGAIDFNNPENHFYQECRIWEGAEISEEALKINGFTREEITSPDKKSLEEAIKNFLIWISAIKDQTLAGENPDFDRNFLKFTIEFYRFSWPFGHRVIDLHSLSYAHHLSIDKNIPLNNFRSNLSLDETLEYIGLPRRTFQHHALTDAKLEAEAFSRIIFGKSLLKEFQSFPVPEYLKK